MLLRNNIRRIEMKDTRYIIFSVLIEYEENSKKKYKASTISDYMQGQTEEECWRKAELFCKESGNKLNSKWTVCDSKIITF
jgi:hypothetical protein